MAGKKLNEPIILEHGTYTIKARHVNGTYPPRYLEDIVSIPPMVAKGDKEEVMVGFDTWKDAPNTANSKRVYAFDDETGDILVWSEYAHLMLQCQINCLFLPTGHGCSQHNLEPPFL